MAESITLEEIVAEMARIQNQAPGLVQGCTVRELSQKLEMSDVCVRRELRRAMAAGLVQCVREKRLALDGVWRFQPAYRAVKRPDHPRTDNEPARRRRRSPL